MLNPRALTLVAMILAAAATRLMPPEFRPWNFTALGAVCLFGGAYFPRSWQALLVALTALAVSDVILAATRYGFESLLHVGPNYVLFALTVLMGRVLRDRVTPVRVGGIAIAANVMFFVLSNLMVWLTGELGYPFTPAGLWACYVAALPFAESQTLGDLFFSAVLFGGYELLLRHWPALRQPAVAGQAACLR